MNELELARLKIDEIDSKIIELYEQRMTVVKDVIKYKINNNIEITDTNREAIMLEKNLKKIENEEYNLQNISFVRCICFSPRMCASAVCRFRSRYRSDRNRS